MNATRTCAIVALMCAGALGATSAGCELMVQLDRSAVVVPEAGCNICSDAGEEGGNDSSADALPTDTGADAGSTDSGAEGSVKDAIADTSTSDAAAGE
jgi:hypothetical protein